MSFYGNIKRVDSSPYVFDRIYPNRKAMEDAAAKAEGDGIYIGRYVLVKYTCQYKNPNDSNSYAIESIEKYTSTDSGATKEYSQGYQQNINTDTSIYNDTFDGTVWQKIYTNIINEDSSITTKEKYIMIAELNAAIPKIDLSTINAKYLENGEEKWHIPAVDLLASTEESYNFVMPEPLKLAVDSNLNYGKELIESPAIRKVLIKNDNEEIQVIDTSTGAAAHKNEIINGLEAQYNTIDWENIFLENSNTEIDGKVLKMQMYGIGQLISNIYDLLYGIPDSEVGTRPFYTGKDISEILNNYDKGLIGILTSISSEMKGDPSQDTYGRTLQSGQYYYLISKWGDAQENPDSFIENVPKVVGKKEEGAAKAHFWLDFDNETLSTVF